MSWIPLYVPEQKNATDIVPLIQKLTKQLSPAQEYTMKIVMSDQEDGKARGVIFYESNGPDPETFNTGTWATKTYTTSTKYDTELYQPAAEFLEGLTASQAVNARIAMTNYHGGQASLTVFYPPSG